MDGIDGFSAEVLKAASVRPFAADPTAFGVKRWARAQPSQGTSIASYNLMREPMGHPRRYDAPRDCRQERHARVSAILCGPDSYPSTTGSPW